MQASTSWEMLPSRQRTRSAPRNWTRFAARYSARGLPCERFTAALASRSSCITRGRGGWLDLPRGGLSPPILCQLSWRTLGWVINGSGRASELGPFIPQQRTCGASGGMSEKCHERKSNANRLRQQQSINGDRLLCVYFALVAFKLQTATVAERLVQNERGDELRRPYRRIRYAELVRSTHLSGRPRGVYLVCISSGDESDPRSE